MGVRHGHDLHGHGAPEGAVPAARGPLLLVSSSESGRINPLLAIAAELAGRGGCDLVVATTDDRREAVEALAPGPAGGSVRFASLGAPHAETLPSTWDDEAFRAFTVASRAEAAAAYFDLVLDADYLQGVYERVLAVVDEVQPALIVADQDAAYAFDAASARGVPYVMTVPIPLGAVYGHRVPPEYPKTFSGLPLAMTPEQAEQNLQFERELGSWASQAPGVKEFMEKRLAGGFANPACISSVYADGAEAVLGLSVFGIEYAFPDLPENLRMVGALVPPEPPRAEQPAGPDSLEAWLDAHESIVYIGFGTIMRPSATQIAALVEAVRRLPEEHHVLWRLPEAQQRLLPPADQLPERLRIESWLPSQTAVLAHPHVKVFFNHGGGNAVGEGSWFGKRLLVMPFWMDCYDWAARVVESGIGLAVEYAEEPDAAAIATALTRLFDEESFAGRAAELREKQRAAGGLRTAADLVLRHAAGAAAPAKP